MTSNVQIREVSDAYTLNDLLYEALNPLGYPCNEEPTGSAEGNSPYIIWRQTGIRSLYASGVIYEETVFLAVILYAPKNTEHLPITQKILAKLREAGCLYARAGLEVWVADVNRRECPVNCAIRVRRV